MMESREEAEGAFSPSTKRRLVEDFAVAYYNGSLKPNLAEKNQATGRDAEFLMDGPQYEKIKRSEIWSYSPAVGTGYQYRVVYRDRRFSDLNTLLQAYSSGAAGPEGDGLTVERRLYEMILLLVKEGRVPQTFKLKPASDPRMEALASEVESLRKLVGALEERVMRIEGAQETQIAQISKVEPSSPP